MDEEKDDTVGEDSSNFIEEEESSLKTKKNRKERKSRAQGKNKVRFMFQAVVVCMVIQTYFVLDYVIAGPLEDFQSRAVNEMHLIGEIQYTSAFTWNAIYNYAAPHNFLNLRIRGHVHSIVHKTLKVRVNLGKQIALPGWITVKTFNLRVITGPLHPGKPIGG